MKLLLAIVLCATAAFAQERGSSQYGDQFPDAPEPIKQVNGHWAHDHSQDPPRWYQHTFTKKFDLALGAFVGANIVDIELTQHCQAKHTCVESGGYESRGEMYRNDMIADGAMIAFSVMVQSFHLPKRMGWIAYIAPTYGTAVHVRGAIAGARYF